jgi:hypothetical protein
MRSPKAIKIDCVETRPERPNAERMWEFVFFGLIVKIKGRRFSSR